MAVPRARLVAVAAAAAVAILVADVARGADAPGLAPPFNASAPRVSGAAVVGGTLSGSNGGWTGLGISYATWWIRCDAGGGNCGEAVGGADGDYVIAPADAGSTLRFVVVATNHNASVVAVSEPTAAVSPPGGPADDPTPTATTTAATTMTTTATTTATTTTATTTATTPPTTTTTATPVTTTTVAADVRPPSAPAGVAVSAAQTTLGLSWSPSTDDVAVAGYSVYVDGTVAGSTTSASFTISSRQCGTAYSIAIDAFDAAGNRSPRTAVAATTAQCSPPPSVVSSSIYWGAYIEGTQTYSYLFGGSWGNAPWDSAAWDKFESNAGKRISIEHYGQPPSWEEPFSVAAANLVTGRGAIPLIDVSSKSASLADIANGSYDGSLTTWAQAVKAWGKPFFFRWNWEMNGTWFPWGAQAAQNPAAYIAAWRHFHDLTERVGATNITWVWCPNLEYSESTPYEQVYPGDAYVDWTCLDGYNMDPTSRSFASLYTQSYNHLLKIAPNKPIMIAETSSREYEPGAKASWITDMLSTQLPNAFPRVKALVWFNWRIYEYGVWKDWQIESSSTAQAAFAGAIASPYYAAGGPFSALPLLTKIQPL